MKVHIIAGGRAVINGLYIEQGDLKLYYINILSLKTLLYSLILRLFFTLNLFSRLKNYNAWFSLLLSILFLTMYSLIIAYGRSIPRGLDYTLLSNIYYSYIPYIIAIVGIALFSYNYNNFQVSASYVNYERHSKVFYFKYLLNILTIIGLVIIIWLNGTAVFELGKKMRFDYSSKRHEVIELIKTWAKTQGVNSKEYFIVNSCVGNDYLEWFNGVHIRKNSGWEPPFTLADALWPEKSFMLNKNKLEKSTDYSIKKIICIESSTKF